MKKKDKTENLFKELLKMITESEEDKEENSNKEIKKLINDEREKIIKRAKENAENAESFFVSINDSRCQMVGTARSLLTALSAFVDHLSEDIPEEYIMKAVKVGLLANKTSNVFDNLFESGDE